MALKIYFLITLLNVSILKLVLAAVIPSPKQFATHTHITELTLDFGIPLQGLRSDHWNWQGITSNSSGGVLLMNGNSSLPSQTMLRTNGLTTSGNWRIDVQINPIIYLGSNSTPCPIIGFLQIDGVNPPVLNSDNTMSDFRGLAVWIELCPGGSVRVFYSKSKIALYDPFSDFTSLSCSSCSWPSDFKIPRRMDVALIVAKERFGFAIHWRGERYPRTCFTNILLPEYASLLLSVPMSMSIVTLNGEYSRATLWYYTFYQLGSSNWQTNAYGLESDFLIQSPLGSSYQIKFDHDLSFEDFNKFTYLTTPGANASSTIDAVNLVPANQTIIKEVSIISQRSIAPNSSHFRAEIFFRLKNFNTSADAPSIFLYFIIADHSMLPLSGETDQLSNFQGFIAKIELGSSMTRHSAYFSNKPSENVTLSNLDSNSCSYATNNTDLTANEIVKMNYGVITLLFYDDNLTATLFAWNSPIHPMPVALFSNHPMAGFGAVLANMTNATIQIMQHNPGDALGTINLDSVRFWASGTPLPTSKLVTTTSSTTSTTTNTMEILNSIYAQKMPSPAIEELLNYESPVTGFPIPELAQGSPIPQITFDDILHCPFIQPSVRAPNFNSTRVYVTFSIDRLLDIDDLDETIAITATMFMQWAIGTCHESYTASIVNDVERIIVTDYDRVWHPSLIFANSSDDVFMKDANYGSDMQILYVPTRPLRTLYFYWTQIGIFTSKCELDLRKFPFDSQKCDFTFAMKEPNGFVQFGGMFLKSPDMSPNGQWILSTNVSFIGSMASNVVTNGQSSFVKFQMSFDRNPSYHIYNLLAPCFVLILLVLGSYLMPPEKPDRPVICCTILLAFVVAQSEVIKEVPHTSQRILLAEYILLFTGLTGLATFYDMAMCGLARGKGFANSRIFPFPKLKRFEMRVVRAFDVAAALISINFLIIMNLYAIVVVNK